MSGNEDTSEDTSEESQASAEMEKAHLSTLA